ncbi:hypothetical protein CLAIMM_06084 [Cladophialophora immunda]|nr:hypothetical protein CLAIMM_06084 [Cladophialophora immunda]
MQEGPSKELFPGEENSAVAISAVLNPLIDAEQGQERNQISDKALEVRTEERTDVKASWDGPDDPECPLNWPERRKWTLVLLASAASFATLSSGTLMAPGVKVIGRELGMNSETTQLTLSIFVVWYGFGPMLVAPMTELYGRRPVWLVTGLWFTVWNVICGFSHTKSLLIVGRLFAGLGASSSFAITNPILTDCFPPEKRGRSLGIATTMPLLGPAFGPIVGGFIVKASWRWLFWTLSIFTATLLILGLFLFPETSTKIILRRRAARLRRQSPPEPQPLGTADGGNMAWWSEMKQSFRRPMLMLRHQGVIQVVSLYLCVNLGTAYLVMTTYASLWIDKYGFSTQQAGLQYISVALGFLAGAHLGGLGMDRIYRRLKQKAGSEVVPEVRVPLMIPAGIFSAIGLLWYGWSAQAKAHWVVPDLGILVFSFGNVMTTQASQAYVMDAFPHAVAAGAAASQIFRSVTAFAFPIFGPIMYAQLGYGWGNTLLAVLSLVLGLAGPAVLWVYGAQLRARGLRKSKESGHE